MSTLKDLSLLAPISTAKNSRQHKLAIYHTSTTAVTNGGCCCCWVVPTGVTWATFEVWGGGGTGAGACCCMGPMIHGGTGHYGTKTISVTAGNYFCTCAATSHCCSQSCCGSCGFPSYVLCGSNGTNVICASGGNLSCTNCWRSYQGCTGICYSSCNQGCNVSGHDLAIPAMASPTKESNYCWNSMWSFASGSTMFGNNFRTGLDYCTTGQTYSGCQNIGPGAFPGGGGSTARACGGGCCWGGWGAGGLVLITYG